MQSILRTKFGELDIGFTNYDCSAHYNIENGRWVRKYTHIRRRDDTTKHPSQNALAKMLLELDLTVVKWIIEHHKERLEAAIQHQEDTLNNLSNSVHELTQKMNEVIKAKDRAIAQKQIYQSQLDKLPKA